MMKKSMLSVLMVFGLTISAIYAADFKVSIGIGGDFGPVFTSFNTNIPEPYKREIEQALKNTDITRGGFCFFLDLTYFEINLGGKFYNITMKQDGPDLKETQSYFNIGIMGKYPFELNDRFSLFPLLGFDFQILTKFKDAMAGYSVEVKRSELSDYDVDKTYFDRTVFNLGLGLDFLITKEIFLRGIFVYGINFHTKQQKDAIDEIKDMGYNISVLNHGPSIKLALGYKF
jgi:hypothetical protein